MLLRRRARRKTCGRLVYLWALIALFGVAPGASGAPAALDLTVTITGTLGSNGWYRGDVTVNWNKMGEEGSRGCDTVTLRLDTPGTKITCKIWIGPEEDPTEQISQTVTIKLDKTGPSLATAPERPADANGWYNRPFTVAFVGTDATSGVASCTSPRYSGPDNAAAAVSGSCSDIAGNTRLGSFSFKYDATPPTIFAVTAKHANRSARLSWRKSADTKLVEVIRAPGRKNQGETAVYRGPAMGFRDTGLAVGRKYQYRVVGVDEAANRAERKLDFVATGALFAPLPGARVTKPPNLVWTPVKGATYYNLQLIRGDKVLSAWPTGPHFRLRRTWTYRGRRHRLRPGMYRWYVWPGLGRISAARYGQPLGSSTFVVTG